MAVREIVLHTDNFVRKKSKPVKVFDEHLWDLGVFRKTYLQQTEIVSVDVIGLGLTVVQRLSLAH